MMYSRVQMTWSDQSFRRASLTGSAAALSEVIGTGSFPLNEPGRTARFRPVSARNANEPLILESRDGIGQSARPNRVTFVAATYDFVHGTATARTLTGGSRGPWKRDPTTPVS